MQHQDQEATNGSMSLSVGKSDSASDAGDDASSVKSGSIVSNISSITTHQEPSATSSAGALSINSSSPWSATTPLSGLESGGPWGNNSVAPTSISNFGWNSTPSSLSMPTNNNQGLSNNVQQNLGGSSSFNSTMTGWSGISSNPLTSSSGPPNLNNGLQTGNNSSQWPGSNNLLGSIGDYTKSASEPSWNNVTDANMNKENNVDPRLWGLATEKPPEGSWSQSKPQWATSPVGASGDQGDQLSFAQAALKGISTKPPPPKPNSHMTIKNEEILRAIENHDGWGSRHINQDSNWDVENSPKSHRKFSTDNNPAQASNVWNNRNGTAIWDSVRDNSNWSGNQPTTSKPWNTDKDQNNWGAAPKSNQDSWAPGTGSSGQDSKAFGMWGGPGAGGDAGSNAGSKMWGGQNPDTRSWGMGDSDKGRSGGISQWGGDSEPTSWDDPRRNQTSLSGPVPGMMPPTPGMGGPSMQNMGPQGMVMPGMGNMQGMPPDNGAAWNDAQKSGWSSANPGMQRTKMDEPWNKPPPKMSGWGDPAQNAMKDDDGTGLWGNNPKPMPPSQPKPGGWGDNNGPQGQWNAPVGTKPKAPWDETSYALAQRTKSGGNPNDVSGNSVEVGTWNGLPQNNTWNDPPALRGVRKITGQVAPPKYNSGGSHPTQMRAKLLQQLMDMGFRKEEAQNALITNNMNLDMAINELNANRGLSRKDLETEVYPPNGIQSRMPPFPPKSSQDDFLNSQRSDQAHNFNMSMQNTPPSNAQVPPNHFFPNTSLPPSSLNTNVNSINPTVSSKLIQKMQVAPPGNAIGSRGNTSQSNEQVQQHIVAQLRTAVNSGMISPQLLNYTLPRNMLVLLQQLLQLQTTRQNLITRLQQQSRQGMRPQMDQHNANMNNINSQMMSLQKQLQHAQNVFFSSQKPPNMSQPPSSIMSFSGQQPGGALAENIDAISTELANASIGNQSRLATQWKPGSESSEMAGSSPGMPFTNLNNDNQVDKTNNSNYMSAIGGGLGILGDSTWSSVSSSASTPNWPSSSGDSVTTNAPVASSVASSAGLSDFTHVIPEFVPGKPWTGLPKGSVEDDPHITPGSMQRSLSVNKVHDDSLNSLSKSGWSSAPRNDNSLGLGNLGSRPPPPPSAPSSRGGVQSWSQGGNPIYARQNTWGGRSGNSAFTQVGATNWNEPQNQGQGPSNWIVLKNLGFMDQGTSRTLAQRYGDVINFYYIPENPAALIQYGNREIAMTAQRSLNNFSMGNTTIRADFISDSDAQKAISQLSSHSFQQTMAPVNTNQWAQAPPSNVSRSGEIWGQSNNPWGGQSLWGDSSAADQNCNSLLNMGILD